MGKMSGFSTRIFFVFTLISVCRTRFFQDGFDHHYVYKAKSDFLGMHNVTTIIKFHVQRQLVSEDGNQVNMLWLDSFVQFSQDGEYADNPMKWNLTRPFLFTVSPRGIVLHVFVHPEEQDEVSTLKKVISSTFSANVIIKDDTQWTYTSTDSDHIGVLSHEYSVTRTGSGLRVSRYHRSVEHVERIHAKTMHMDNYGTVESVDGEDNIILENRLNSDFETKRIPYPEEYVIKTTEEGDIGVIKANAAINVKLLSKRRTRPSTRKPIEYNDLRLDKVLYQKNKIQKHSLASLEANIKAAITCSHQYSDKSNTNRTICVNNLRQNITALNAMDYEHIVSEFLSKACGPNDTKCEDERYLFIDIVAREGDDLSQKLIVKYALQETSFDEEAIRRALIHFTTLVKPIPETVAAVERLCFGENNEHHGSVKMTLTSQRACLSLGVLVKALGKNGNDTEANAIMEKLHRWLYKQGDETPEHLRPRRSTINVDVTVSSDHLLSKFVLLHSLGNAAQLSSLQHLHEYAKPNARIPAWRRAALSAMKYDKSNKTAQVLLDSLTFEKTETVRATAMEQFLVHPLQHNFSKSLSDILLSQNYSYPTVVRLKRAGDLNDVLLEFKVELPEVHWGKSVGNAKIGASFGVDMVNRMHLRIKPLSGFFHINIWDRVYAEAHVGILGIHVDILRIEACYRGKLEYNLNILKDFSYGEAQRDFDEYDQAASAIVSPIVNAVDGISEHFKTPSGHKSVFKPLTDAVKDIPVKARKFLDSSLALLSVLDSYQGIALVSRAKLFAFKVQGLAEDMKADTLNFYNELADTALIVLPHAETQITEASNMMIEAQKTLGSKPQQAFETINMAKQRIKKATYQIIKAKSVLQNALSPHGGSLPTWISSQDEIDMAISAAQGLLTEIKSLQKYVEAVAEEDIDNFVNWQGITDIQKAVERVVTDMENFRADVEPFHVVVTDTLLKMQNIKLSVDKLDKKTKETQNNVKKSFGPKFNKAFPAQRRETDRVCGRGVWPSHTGGRYTDTPGIDVIVEEREKVVCPVNGKVFRTCEDDEVRIVPSDENFKMFTILIRNIRLEDSISVTGSEFKAGQILGRGKGKSGCTDPYIHVAMRKNAASGVSTCSYVDPSSYVDNIKPFPKWQEECKEFVFKHIGNVIEAGLSGLGFEEIVEELAKRAMAWAGAEMVQKIVSHFPKSQMAKIAGTMAFAYLSQYNAEIANAFTQPESQRELMDKKCEEMKTATTTPPTASVEPPKQSFSAGKQEVNKMIENLQGDESLQQSRQAIQDVINRLNRSSSSIGLDDMSSMAFSRYGKILNRLNIPFKGSKQSMETTIQMLTWNVCPTFENGIAQGYGHLCIPTNDCFGLNCTIRIPDGIRKERVTLGVVFNRSDLTFTLFTTNNSTQIAIDGTRKQHDIQNIMPGYEVTLFSHTNIVNISVGKAYQLTVSVVPCDISAKCLPEVHIFHNLTFLEHLQQRQIRSSGAGCSFSAEVGIDNLGHIGGSLEVDKSGHVSSGGVDLGVKAGDVNIDGGFHTNNQGEWGVNIGADVDLGDGKSVGTEMYLEGNGDDLTLGLGIEAQLGQSGSVGGFIAGNTDGELSAGIHGNVNIGNSNISGSGYIHHDKNGTSGGGMVAANINGKGHIAASLNASSDGRIDAGISGSAQIGNSTISGAGYIHHDKNGTSGGGMVAANINGKGQIAASLNASSDGKIDAGISGSAQIGNSTISGAGYIHHDKNGTSGGGMVAANINGKGQIAASLNASSDGTIDTGASGSAQIGNSTISGAGYIHHDKNGTSGGGMVAANINGEGKIAASLNASSDGKIDAGASGSAQIGNSTISGAGYIHHDKNGTSGGGIVAANINGKGHIAASLNASSDGTIDAGASGSAQIGNSTISGAGYIHHDKNGTSGGGMVAANINGKGQIAASLNASSDGTIDAGASGSAQIGNSTISGAGYIHHDKNGTSGGGMVSANINGEGQIAASLNASSDGKIDAGASGSAQIGNSTISGAGYIHHDKNGTSGGGMVAANINGKGQIAASLNASSDGTIDAGASGSAQIGNATISGAGYIHHDKNGTSGGGLVSANINGEGQIAASLNASSDGKIDAGASGSAQIGNSTISGAGYIHHDKNGTSGGGMVSANINGEGQIAASLNASSDGKIYAGASGSAQIGNSTISGAGYIHHDKNGTSGGGMVSANINGEGKIAASLNTSSDGTIDAGASGSAQIGNSTISAAGYIHHDKNGTSGGGMVAANINDEGKIAASLNASSDGTIDAGASGSAQIGNSTISGAGYIHHDKNGTSGGGMVAANVDGEGKIAASLNASSDGTIDAGASGSAQISNSTISGTGYIHHDNNGTSGGGMVAANIDGEGKIAASLNASSDGTIDAGASGSALIGNSTISGAGYIHHDKNGTSGGGMVAANIDGEGKIAASLNASSDGTLAAGASGSAQIGTSTISGTGYIHHDKNDTSGGGMVAANIDGEGKIAASLNASSDGTIDAGASGSAQIGNSTISGAGYIHHDKNGTNDGGVIKDENDSIHILKTRSANKCSVGLSANVGENGIGIGADANIPGFGKVGAHVTFKDGQIQGDLKIGDFSLDLGDAQKLTMDTINQLASDLNIKSDTTDVMSGFREGMRHQVCKSETELTVGYNTETMEEDFPARDRRDGVTYKDKHTDITIFKVEYTFGVGPIGIKLAFGAGGAIGTSMWSDIHANKGTAAFSIGPWVSGMVWGGLSIELGIASGGLKLIGYILKTKFPVTMETKSNKHPLTVVMNIDLELTPIELSLRGWAKVFFAKVFDKCLWKWACPPITWNILRKELENKDKVPPQFVNGSFCGDYRTKQEGGIRVCSVRQIPNRHPSDTAFQLEVSATDDDSSVKTWYAIGTSQGGKDVQGWTKFKGDNQVVPCKLPNGVPLFFTIKAQNQQGLESYLHCKLDTYDNTLPDGRVEASHKFSSHPGILAATVIVNDDSPIKTSYKALGLSPGQFGREIKDWTLLSLSKTTIRSGVSSDLKHFSPPRKGKLIVVPIESSISRSPENCARKCISKIKCISFDYEQSSETCQLYDVIESHANKLYTKGDFYNYERLGRGFSAFIEYQNLPLEHGMVYYVNVLIENTLDYRSALFSEGTLIDFTPPLTGYLGNVSRDVTVSHRCEASRRQRCEEVTDIPNHRLVVDGPDGKTVFNGNKPLQDTKYTLTNHYVTANWDGFDDPESGIWGFTWAVGIKLCGQDIVQYEDPHKHISSPKYWTFSGFHEGVALQDGEYYVTIEALNSVVFGGAMVTTVCHSVPFTVDTTPPYFYNITDVLFDEDFDILAAYYNVSDRQSGISRVDFGLGTTKHDVVLRAYSRHGFMDRNDPYLVIENLELQPGIPAWVRLRAVNKVGLFASGHANAPIMVDKTPPIPGIVLDGNLLREDTEYQHDTKQICAQWQDFFDPESGIKRFLWGVGSQPKLDDIAPFRNISKFERQACAQAHLRHNVTYFSTVVVLNDALNSRRSNSSSDGVLVDVTPPIPGTVDDRIMDFSLSDDIDFTSETATVEAAWRDFYDAESGIDHFDIKIEVNNETAKFIPKITDKKFTDHSLTLRHLDFIKVEVSSANGAKLQTKVKSDGALVDHTPPKLHYIYDTKNGTHFQSEKTKLYLKWQFSDPESGIAEYRYKIEEFDAGMKTTIFPEHGDFITAEPKLQQVSMELEDLQLKDGALYKVHVIALNKARLSSSHVSDGVLVDTTPPVVKNVKLAMPSEEEDLDETDTYVLLASSDTLTVSWLARDSESGIQTIKIGVGVAREDTSVTNGFIILNSGEAHTTLHDLKLLYFKEEFPVYYYVSVKAINKAGLESDIIYSRPIKILHENVPGTVYDGRQALQDNVYTRDKTSIGISFSGFESETCNIIGYEWAVGTEPYLTDILPFTDYGIVILNESEGHAQISLELYESQTYYASVRARTGQLCKQEFIMSVSDGITLDSNGPDISFYVNDNKYTSQQVVHQMKPIYQKITENVDISWSVTDMSGIDIESWSIGSLPEREDIHDVTVSKGHKIPLNSVSLNAGTANFVTIRAKDNAGNTAMLTSPAVIADISVPEVKDFSCTKVLSNADSLLMCKWSLVADRESPIISLSYGISSSPLALDVLNFTDISVERRTWFRNIGTYILNTDTEKIYMSLRIKNAAGHVFITEETAVIDRTPPIKGTIQIVTRETFTSSHIANRCQVSEQNIEIEVKGFRDDESGLSRLEIGLGSETGKTDILTFAKFELKEYIFIDGLQLFPGMAVFATVRVYNKVNLYSTSFSGSMVISPSPNLSVLDGNGQNDEDYSSQLNVIQGRWKYTDSCPIISAEWSVQELAGNVIQKFKPIVNANTHFFNDEIRTENEKTYINIIRTTDALNRTRLARSDGITVRIQPPKVSNVRDGSENEDVNYQRSISELTGNWDEFGDKTDKNPSQIIVRYEVAVGNDRRFPNTRTNVYPFVNVGLNRTVTFQNLKLKAKLVRYYLTVRAYSAAGSYVEGYSNGIRVGFEEIVQPGYLKYNEFQSSEHSIEIGWTDFISDYGIRHYEIAVGTTPPNITNDTVDCNTFKTNNINFDIKPLSAVGLNTFAKIEGILLSHGKRYYVTILAEDETKSCIAVTSGPILIDTTRPTIGKVFLNNKEMGKRYNFINTTHLKVSWNNFSDNESGILYYHILLAEKVDCSLTENFRHEVQEKRVNITEVTFYQLQEEKQYIVKLTATNNANLSNSVTIATIFVDKIRPLTGNVKAGFDWQHPISVQQSLTTMNATILIAKTRDGYMCPLQTDISPSSQNLLSTWHPMKGDYAPSCVSVTKKGLRIEVKTDEHIFTDIVKGGVETNEMEMLEGSYTLKMTGLRGDHMVSSVSISREISCIPFNFNDSLDDVKEPSELFDNNTSYEQPQDGMKRMSRPHRYGTGFFIPGYRIRNETNTWNILFWAADMYNLKYAWITVSFDPTEIDAKYDLTLMKENDTDVLTWSVMFSVNDIEKATIDTMAFQNKGKVYIIGYNNNGFVPEVDDIFNPFYSEIKLSSVHVPSLKDTPCRYGKPFFDAEGGIHEIWAGVSNSQNETETIMQFDLQKRYCLPCENKCPNDCDPDCSSDTTNPLEVLYITLSNLTLLPSSNKSRELSSNITSGSDFSNFSTESYYMNVKVVDFAGNIEEAISEAVIIDNTPPKFIQLSCVDPVHSLDEPALYQGTNSSVAAFWDCEDDISDVTKYTTCVGSSPGVCNIKSVDNIGLKTSVLIEGLGGLLHDGTTYFVTITAYNAAGMKTSESCNITVELQLPNTGQSKSTEMFSIPVANALPNVAFSDRTDRLGIHWESKHNDTEFYEWEIGSNGTTPDIFPRVKIGTKKSTKAAIIDGHLWLDGVNINTTVKEYVLKNWTEEEIAKAHTHGNFFNFEPGRCVHVNLYSVNRAHLSSKIHVKPICMKRKEDVLMNFEQKTLHKVTAIGKMLHMSNAGVVNGNADLELTANGSAGGILVGMLETADVDGMYGSSASDTYRSYISSPVTKTKTSRLLRNRFRRYSGMSFYVSPTGYTKLNEFIEVNIRFNNTENSYVPALIYWDQDLEEWRKVTEECKTEEHIDFSTRSTSLYTAKVCLPSHMSSTQRERRSIDMSTEVYGPRQFALVFISKEITQTQPIIKTESLFFKEDEAAVHLRAIDVFDAENDNVTFRIVDYPKHGSANITLDGQLYYKPNPDFSGKDEVVVECKETTLPQSLKPSPVRAKINLFVTEVNDAPDLLFLRDNNTFTGSRRNEIILPFESNVTEYFIGTFVASDIDLKDSLTENVFDSSNSEANLTLSEVDDLNLLEKFKSGYTKDAGTVKMYQLELSMSKDFFGVIDYGLIVHDNAGHWSLPIKLSIAVLYNPCVFGKCAPSKNLQCTDLTRAESFHNFHCKCQAGYEGVWCETETNECSREPCALMFDCEDLVAGFKCNINMPKLFAILICSLLAVGAVCFVVYRKKQQLNKNMKVSNIDLHDLNRHKCSPLERFSDKYGQNVFDADEDEQTSDFHNDVTASQTEDNSVEQQEVNKSDNVFQGLPLASAGTLRPPHLKSSILTHFKNKRTPIDN